MANTTAWAGVSQSVPYNVHIGTWINWSRGSIMGATLTMNRQYGSLLTAFTAFFVGIVASSFWSIVCMVFHRTYSTPCSRDALHHQRQVVLRNSPSAASGLWATVQLAWAWNHRAKTPLARTLPIIICAACSMCAFTVAGGFSSWISSGIGDEVLLDGINCAVFTHDYTDESVDAVTIISPYISQITNSAANYAQQCYSTNTTGLFDCTSLVTDHLPATVDNQAPCPFQDGICRSNSSNLRLDTGFLDSREDLGLNTPDEQRILYRQVLHCAPLDPTDFAVNVSTSRGNYTEYWYGPDPSIQNFTFAIPDVDAQYAEQQDDDHRSWGVNFRLILLGTTTVNSSLYPEISEFIPIPELFRPDGDLSLVFLSGNGVDFLEETNDPWYRGAGFLPDGALYYTDEPDQQQTLYKPQDAASPMGCVMQFQYCNAKGECGDLASYVDAIATAAPFFDLTTEDMWVGTSEPISASASRFLWFGNIISSAIDLNYLLQSLGASSLLSQQSLQQGCMGKLPDNQWQLDVTHWWGTVLAALQAAFINTAIGPNDAALMPYTTFPNDTDSKTLCNNQKVLSTDYASFSLFGLYFTYITGALIILASYTLGLLLACLHRTRGCLEHHAFLEWATDETLQLQRLAYQGLGSGSWSGYTDAVPRTRPGEALGSLPLAYAAAATDGKKPLREEEGVPLGDAGEKGGEPGCGTRRAGGGGATVAAGQDVGVVDGSEAVTITVCTSSGSVAPSRASCASRDEHSPMYDGDTVVSPLSTDYHDEGEEPRLHDAATHGGCSPSRRGTT